MNVTIPIRLPSLANCRMHWRAMDRLKRQQKTAVAVFLNGEKAPDLPAVVTITRIGPRALDDDNCAGACKYVRDQIARWYGVDDGSRLYRWVYAQERSKTYGVRIQISPIKEVRQC